MKKYNPSKHFDAEAERSSAGKGESPGKFSFHALPHWSGIPQWWSHIEKGMKVLDIGSGIGLEVGKLTEKGVFAVGCDVSPKMINLARENCLSHGINSPNFVLWNGLSLPFKTDTFDRVTTNTVLQHVVDDVKLKRIFSEVNRSLIPGGLFLISEVVGIKTAHVFSHMKIRTPKDYITMANAQGFTLIGHRKGAKLYLSLSYSFFLLRNFFKPFKAGKNEVPGPSPNHNEKSNTSVLKRKLDRFCARIDRVLDKWQFFPLLATQDSLTFKKK